MNNQSQSFLYSSKFSQITKGPNTVTITVFPTKLLVQGLKNQNTKSLVNKEVLFQTSQYVVDWEYNHATKTLEGFSLCKNGNHKYRFQGSHDQLSYFKDILNGLLPSYNWEKEYQFKSYIRKTNKCQVFLAQRGNIQKVIKQILDFEISQELRILQTIKKHPHRNVLGFDQYYINQQNCFVVMDCCQYGTLYELQKSFNSQIPLPIVKNVMQQILEGLNHLHSLNIMHRDLKYDNVMISNLVNLEVKIIDFGLSIQSLSTDSRAGTGGYIAPEVFTSHYTTEKSDVFSAGVILHKLLTCKGVYDSLHENQIGEMKINPHIRDSDTLDLIHQMLEKDPENRYSAADCLAHPFFTDETDQLSSKSQLIEYLSPKQVKLQVRTPSTGCVSANNIHSFKLS